MKKLIPEHPPERTFRVDNAKQTPPRLKVRRVEKRFPIISFEKTWSEKLVSAVGIFVLCSFLTACAFLFLPAAVLTSRLLASDSPGVNMFYMRSRTFRTNGDGTVTLTTVAHRAFSGEIASVTVFTRRIDIPESTPENQASVYYTVNQGYRYCRPDEYPGGLTSSGNNYFERDAGGVWTASRVRGSAWKAIIFYQKSGRPSYSLTALRGFLGDE